MSQVVRVGLLLVVAEDQLTRTSYENHCKTIPQLEEQSVRHMILIHFGHRFEMERKERLEYENKVNDLLDKF
jgi:hypothetical protein